MLEPRHEDDDDGNDDDRHDHGNGRELVAALLIAWIEQSGTTNYATATVITVLVLAWWLTERWQRR